VPGPALSNYLIALRSLAAQHRRIKPRHPTAVLFLRLGIFYQCFGADAHLLSRVAHVPLRFYGLDRLPVAEIPVLRCEKIMRRILRQGRHIIIWEQASEEIL